MARDVFFAIKNGAGIGTVFYLVGLLLRNSAHGAGVSAAAAIQAGVGVDLVLRSALSDRTDGAGISAGTAADASVTDLISHGMYTSI